MRRIVLVHGLVAGAFLAAMMVLTFSFFDRIGFDNSAIVGYTTMVLAFLMVYFGIRAYRDSVAGGTVRFGRAFAVGILIVLVASACYVATWQVMFYGGMTRDFMARYTEHTLAESRAEGATEAELAEQAAEMRRFAEMYENPLVNAGFTFLEIFPVGLVVTLVSAGILSRRRTGEGTPAAAGAGGTPAAG